jgi:hypothetical protein
VGDCERWNILTNKRQNVCLHTKNKHCVCFYMNSTWWCPKEWKLDCTNIKPVCRQTFCLLFVIMFNHTISAKQIDWNILDIHYNRGYLNTLHGKLNKFKTRYISLNKGTSLYAPDDAIERGISCLTLTLFFCGG